MAVPLANCQRPPVYIDGEELVISELRLADRELVALVSAAGDGEQALRRLLELGVRAAAAAQATLDGQLVERRFRELVGDFESRLAQFSADFELSAERLLRDEEGPLRQSLVGCFRAIRELVNEAADGNSETLAKVGEIFDQAGREQLDALRTLVSGEQPDSPLQRLQAEIVQAVSARGEALEAALAHLAERVAVEKARGELREKTTAKGLDYERQVIAALEQIATPLGEIVSHTGGSAGADGGRAGDAVVTVPADDDSGAAAGCYAVECKDKPVRSTAAALRELDSAARNRGAAAAVLVVSGADYSPLSEPLATFGSRVIVVYDKDDPNPLALRLACAFARWAVRRQSASANDQVNLERVRELLERARQSLGRIKTIEDAHGAARRGLDKATHELETLRQELERSLATAAAELTSPSGANEP